MKKLLRTIQINFSLLFLESLRLNWKYPSKIKEDFWRGSEEEIPSFVSRCFYCKVTLLTMPIAHSCGFTYQLFRNKILKFPDW